MWKGLFKNYVYPIATLSGSIIGVGFLSLPYITLQVGIFTMLFYFVVLTALMLSIHLIFSQISLKTPDYKRFPGFVGYYLGDSAKKITLVLTIFGLCGVLLAYLIIGGEFLTIIFSPLLGGNSLLYVMLYFLAASSIIYFGAKTISRVEFWALFFFLIVLIIVFFKSFSHIKLENIFLNNVPIVKNWKLMFLPYGAILFALWGTGLIPEVEEMLIGRKHTLKKIIIIATLIPAVMYFLFVLMILSITGQATTDSALGGLKYFFGNGIFSLALFVGVATTFTAFIANGLLLKKIFMYDMGLKEFNSWALTCGIPLILFLVGLNAFIPLISFVGGVFLGINGILILLIYRKIGGRKIIIYPLLLVFLLGIVYEMVYFIK